MKDNFPFRLLRFAMPLRQKALLTRQCRKTALREYRSVKEYRSNPWISCYAMGAWFIAVNRKNGLSREKTYESMAESTQECRYENDWVVDLLPGNDDYDLGYN